MNSDVSFASPDPGPVDPFQGEPAPLPAAVPPGRARHFLSRAYCAGMVVRFEERRWEIDSVEFWRHDEKLSLRDLDGVGRVKTREVWASQCEFDEQTGGHEL